MDKRVIVIAAVSQNGVYGKGEKIPWHIPQDFKNFKQLTTSWTVVMGRGTWESLPPGFKPLPHRDNIVITNTPEYKAEGAKVFASIDQAIEAAQTEKIFCIGGVSIWYHAMHIADEAWITIVKENYPITQGVTHTAPELINPSSKWPHFFFNEMSINEDAHDHVPGFSIVHWVRKRNSS